MVDRRRSLAVQAAYWASQLEVVSTHFAETYPNRDSEVCLGVSRFLTSVLPLLGPRRLRRNETMLVSELLGLLEAYRDKHGDHEVVDAYDDPIHPPEEVDGVCVLAERA